jgi:transcriptional regulator with XRE-family HTH domain
MDLEQIGDRLRAEREFRGWTGDRVVEELDFPRRVTPRAIMCAEPAEPDRYPSLRIIMKLLDIYGLELAIVRKGDDGQ